MRRSSIAIGLLFGTGALLQGTRGLVQFARGGEVMAGALVPSLFFVSGGLGFFLAHAILYKRKMLGVYLRSEGASAEIVRAPIRRAPLREALRLYWWALVGIALFPSIMLVGEGLLHIPFEFFVPLFFGVALLAAWPWYSGRAPYSFWLVAGGVYMLGGVVAAVLTQINHAITGH
jgi:hypothetical protein